MLYWFPSRSRFVSSILSLCIVLVVLIALDANAEGLLPNRERHRAHALHAGRRHYRRKFSNDTDVTDVTDKSSKNGGIAGSVSSAGTSSKVLLDAGRASFQTISTNKMASKGTTVVTSPNKTGTSGKPRLFPDIGPS
jgi:hypothetical protein